MPSNHFCICQYTSGLRTGWLTIDPFEKVLARYGATVADKTDLKRNILKRVFYCVSRMILKSHSLTFPSLLQSWRLHRDSPTASPNLSRLQRLFACKVTMAQIRGTAGYNLGSQDRFGGPGRADATNDPSPLEQLREQTSKIEEWLDTAADPIKPCVQHPLGAMMT